jgi:transcriptional regulator with XRE-family HTH domain
MGKKKVKGQSMSDRLREAIKSSGLTLKQLWDKSGVDQGRLSRFLRGERDLTLTSAEKLFSALGMRLVGGPRPKKTTHEEPKK